MCRKIIELFLSRALKLTLLSFYTDVKSPFNNNIKEIYFNDALLKSHFKDNKPYTPFENS